MGKCNAYEVSFEQVKERFGKNVTKAGKTAAELTAACLLQMLLYESAVDKLELCKRIGRRLIIK